MTVFLSNLNQIMFLFGFIIIGYVFAKLKVLPESTANVLSKLENNLFVPCLLLGSFMTNFTVDNLSGAGELLLVSCIVELFVIPFAFLMARIFVKDKYMQNIYTYGLCFSNFAYMGNAVVNCLFPDFFFEYLIFTLPLNILAFGWAVPRLLIADTNKSKSLKEFFKPFINPMFIAMFIGMIIGLFRIPVPEWIASLVQTAGNCMSPVAMILTGVVVSCIPLKQAFSDIKIYLVSLIRLLFMPVVFMVVASLFKMSEATYMSAVFSLAMPLGLSSVVVPSALGKDTTKAASMAIISHLLAAATIPLVCAIM